MIKVLSLASSPLKRGSSFVQTLARWRSGSGLRRITALRVKNFTISSADGSQSPQKTTAYCAALSQMTNWLLAA